MSLMKRVKRWLETVAIRIALEDANTTCACITYQPKLPEAVQKIRKG